MVPFAAKAKLGDNTTTRTHSTKRMTASPFFAVIRSNAQLSHGTKPSRKDGGTMEEPPSPHVVLALIGHSPDGVFGHGFCFFHGHVSILVVIVTVF
jgi:hypothetical protein